MVTESLAEEERHFPGRACGLDKSGLCGKHGGAGVLGGFLTHMEVLLPGLATATPPQGHTAVSGIQGASLQGDSSSQDSSTPVCGPASFSLVWVGYPLSASQQGWNYGAVAGEGEGAVVWPPRCLSNKNWLLPRCGGGGRSQA